MVFFTLMGMCALFWFKVLSVLFAHGATMSWWWILVPILVFPPAKLFYYLVSRAADEAVQPGLYRFERR